jgi:arsenite-transporting ATPase
VPVLTAELAPDELVGLERLGELGAALYGDTACDRRLHRDEPIRLDTRGPSLVLSVRLPFAGRDDVELSRVDGELLLAVGPYRRAVMLPDSLCRREVAGARMVGDRLEVEFFPPGGPSARGGGR